MAFPITPIFYGIGKFGKWAAKYGKDAAQDIRGEWGDEKEKEYLNQIRNLALLNHSLLMRNE